MKNLAYQKENKGHDDCLDAKEIKPFIARLLEKQKREIRDMLTQELKKYLTYEHSFSCNHCVGLNRKVEDYSYDILYRLEHGSYGKECPYCATPSCELPCHN